MFYNHFLLYLNTILPQPYGMKNSRLPNKTNYFRAIVTLPIICLLAFTGCANLPGTAGHQTTTTRQAAAYLEQAQDRTLNPADQDPDPTYEWFY
jgi:hypothetical protein